MFQYLKLYTTFIVNQGRVWLKFCSGSQGVLFYNHWDWDWDSFVCDRRMISYTCILYKYKKWKQKICVQNKTKLLVFPLSVIKLKSWTFSQRGIRYMVTYGLIIMLLIEDMWTFVTTSELWRRSPRCSLCLNFIIFSLMKKFQGLRWLKLSLLLFFMFTKLKLGVKTIYGPVG